MAEDRLDRIEALLEGHAKVMADHNKTMADHDRRMAELDLQMQTWIKEAAQRDAVFDVRIKALLARDEALDARLEQTSHDLDKVSGLLDRLAVRHQALSESVEMMVQSWMRRGTPPPPPAEAA